MNPNDQVTQRRALGAYLGLAVGNALGATVEFLTPEEIRQRHGTHDRLIGGGWLRLAPGKVTADTEMSLAVGQALLDRRGWDLTAVANALAAWLQGEPTDVGNICRRGILRYRLRGTLEAPRSERAAGSGACARMLPVILASLHDERAFAPRILQQCRITHNHPLSDAGALTLGNMTRCLLQGGTRDDARVIAERLIAAHPAFRFDPFPGRAGGYVVETVQTVLHAFFGTDCFASCVTETVNFGYHAATTGALAGMLAGALYGASAIPYRWLEPLDLEIKSVIVEQTRGLLELGADTRTRSARTA